MPLEKDEIVAFQRFSEDVFFFLFVRALSRGMTDAELYHWKGI